MPNKLFSPPFICSFNCYGNGLGKWEEFCSIKRISNVTSAVGSLVVWAAEARLRDDRAPPAQAHESAFYAVVNNPSGEFQNALLNVYSSSRITTKEMHRKMVAFEFAISDYK